MIVPAYTPGTWWLAVADGGYVVLPGEVDESVVVSIWTALRDGAGLTELLTDLLRPGIAAVPPFALIDIDGATVHALVRGEIVVEVTTADGARSISGAQMTTWAEAVVGDARRVVLRTPGSADADLARALPVLSGVVRAAVAVVDLRESRVAGGTGGAAGRRAAAPPGGAGSVVGDPPPESAPARTPAAAPVVGPISAAPSAGTSNGTDQVDDEDDERESVPVWAPVRAIQPERAGAPPAVQSAPRPGLLLSGDKDEEDDRDARTAPQPRVPLSLVPPRLGVHDLGVEDAVDGGHGQDHDGLTVLSSDVVALRRQLPEWAGDEVPSLAVPTPRNPAPAKLVLSTGLVVSLNRPVLLGRAPQVTRVSNNEIPRLVTLASPNQDISRTHAEVRMDGDDVVVTDLRSTNGVLLLRQGSGPQRLHPGEPTVVEPGVVVDLGEGATFLVEAGG